MVKKKKIIVKNKAIMYLSIHTFPNPQATCKTVFDSESNKSPNTSIPFKENNNNRSFSSCLWIIFVNKSNNCWFVGGFWGRGTGEGR